MSRALAATLLGACVLALAAASAAAAPPDPSSNIALGPLPEACARAPRGAACEDAAIHSLDAARAKLGLGRYLLPSGFVKLVPARQWLILSNLDRIAYKIRPITGLALPLDAVAKQGAIAHADPDPGPLLDGLHGQTRLGYASNWAGGQANALLAYYGWMYDDGPGGPNLDCRSPGAPGCWGHRHDILAFPQGGALAMGAAAVKGASYAMTVVDTSRPAWPYGYTWAQAKRAGAG